MGFSSQSLALVLTT